MDRYKQYLATNILVDGKNVTYRALSRELKVHNSIAKQMLFAFHQTQNAKKHKSCHATYIICGTRAPLAQSTLSNGNQSKDGEDVVMQSSPPMSSLPDFEHTEQKEPVRKETIMVVREEHLSEARSLFERISNIYIYSLEPSSLANLNVLSDCTREMNERIIKEDPLVAWKQYGTIQNPNVRRRTGKRPAAIVPPPSQSSKTQSTASTGSKTAAIGHNANKEAPRPSVVDGKGIRGSAGAHSGSVSDLKSCTPSLKKEKSDIMASFGRAKPKEKKPVASEKQAKDETMLDASDNEEELEPVQNTKRADDLRRARSDREADLKRMMEESDDEPMDDASASDDGAESSLATKDEDAAEEDSAPIDKAPAPKEEENASFVEVSGGRRRGRRRVIKKKTTKDEEGYFVTREEAVWESFSEDEPAVKKPKLPSAPVQTAAKRGQGKIMNFFGKK